MEWINEGLGDLNYWLVLLAGVAAMIGGYLWYSDWLFGKQWRRETGVEMGDTSDMKGMMPMFLQSYILAIIAQSVLFAVMILSGASEMMDAIGLALVLGFGFSFTAVAVNNVYQKRSMTLSLIDGGYQMLSLTLGAIVFVLWG